MSEFREPEYIRFDTANFIAGEQFYDISVLSEPDIVRSGAR
jgi:hypothetical protein